MTAALACVTGRFQPVHAQHLSLFELALAECEHLLVAITNPDTDALQEEPASAHRHTAGANPFSYWERARLLGAALQERGLAARCTLVPFELARPAAWPQYVPLAAVQFVRAYSDWEREKAHRFRRAGYAVRLIEGDAGARICASEIRAAMHRDDGRWRDLVPAATRPLLEAFLRERPIALRG